MNMTLNFRVSIIYATFTAQGTAGYNQSYITFYSSPTNDVILLVLTVSGRLLGVPLLALLFSRLVLALFGAAMIFGLFGVS